MPLDLNILHEINERLIRIEKKFNIVPDKDTTIADFEASIIHYKQFALSELKLGQTTINNQISTIRNFLVFPKGIITKQTVLKYLDSNDSDSWKSNQLKALRRYTRDFLKLENWTEEFHFKKCKSKDKETAIK